VKTVVIVPTYNEADNAVAIVEALLATSVAPDIVVVDDSSPDGTSKILAAAIAESAEWMSKVTLVTREGKGGRGGAVREGLMRGLQSDSAYEVFVEMDCDFSHDPADLSKAVAMVRDGSDVVIGARYPDGQIIGWPLARRVFSRLANTVARAMIVWSIPDYTNGFRAYGRQASETILAEPQRHTGYIYLSEALVVCIVAGMKIDSFPIVFRNRERGESSTDLHEISSAAAGIFDVARWYRANRDPER
jgi:dolichol-phosphate mannosyltransferase